MLNEQVIAQQKNCIFLKKDIPFSMSSIRKSAGDGYIRLGHARSPKKKTSGNLQISHPNVSSRFQTHNQSPILCESVRSNIGSSKEKTLMAKSYTLGLKKIAELPVKKSPLKPSVDQHIIYQEKPNIYRRISPQSKFFVKQTTKQTQMHSIIQKKLQNHEEEQLLRKNRILEQRIAELHQEKQASLLKITQQNRRLNFDISKLKKQLQTINNIKTKQVESLKKELDQVCNTRPGTQHKVANTHNSIKNDVYMDSETTSILQIKKQTQSQIPSSQNSEVKQKIVNQQITDIMNVAIHEQLHIKTEAPTNQQKVIQQLRQENFSLKSQLEEIKLSIMQSSQVIEENSQQIIRKYEQQLDILQNRIKQLMSQKKQSTYSIKITQLNDLEELTQQLTKLQQQNAVLNEKIISYKKEEKRKQEKQKNNKFIVQAYEQEKQTLLKKIVQLQQNNTFLEQKYECMREQWEQQKCAFKDQAKLSITAQYGVQVQSQECSKCKQIMKTFMELSTKTYQK